MKKFSKIIEEVVQPKKINGKWVQPGPGEPGYGQGYVHPKGEPFPSWAISKTRLHGELYEVGTYAATPRLQRLRKGGQLTKDDAIELFEIFAEGSQSAGVRPKLQDFGQWLAGTGEFAGEPPAEVVW